jgi:hypothetical protein
MTAAAQAIAVLNVQHYRNLLKTEGDTIKRATILKLLAEEEKKLKGSYQVINKSSVPSSE